MHRNVIKWNLNLLYCSHLQTYKWKIVIYSCNIGKSKTAAKFRKETSFIKATNWITKTLTEFSYTHLLTEFTHVSLFFIKAYT